jgi:uncharacterized protein YdhG (YjbR/CyaY superfamily)
MRKVKPTRAKTRASRNSAPETLEQYLANVPKTSRPVFTKLRAAVGSAVPRDAEEIISYKIPAFRRGVVLVWFAAFADHCSLFPTSSIIAKFKNELKGYSTSKGTIHFPLDQPVPAALIKRIVKARVAEANAKHSSWSV